jgi:hypothetical protein
MARPIAAAKAYYYPTPDEVGREIGKLIDVGTTAQLHILDPCAGTGELVEAVLSEMDLSRPLVRTIELDISRHNRIKKRDWNGRDDRHICGDTFRVQIPDRSFGLVLHNPPYDQGKLEEAWVEKLDPVVAMGGAHVIIIPAHSVYRIRDVIAQSYEEVRIARFPDHLYDRFKQVVILARKCSAYGEYSDDVARILTFDDPLTDLPVLGQDYIPPVRILDGGKWLARWKVDPLDRDLAVSAHRPWVAKIRRVGVVPIPGSVVSIPDILASVSSPKFRTVIPPPTAHISLALAAGALDGAVLEPDDPEAGFPPIAIRGKYERDWVETNRRLGKKGEVYGIEEQQVPTLTISALSLMTGRIHELAQVVDPVYDPELYQNYSNDPDTWKESIYYKGTPLTTPLQLFSSGDLLLWYGRSVTTVLNQRCVPIFDPANDLDYIDRVERIVSNLPRQPYRAQHERIAALLKAFEELDEKRILVPGQTGSGKTTISAQAALTWCLTHPKGGGIQRILVTAPPHLVPEWIDNQLPQILGSDVEVIELDKISTIDNWMDDNRTFNGTPLDGVRISVGVLSRSKAKAGYRVSGIDGAQRVVGKRTDDNGNETVVYQYCCPGCNRMLKTDVKKRGRKRMWCDAVLAKRPGLKDGRIDALTSAVQALYTTKGRVPIRAMIRAVIDGVLAGRIELNEQVQTGLEALFHAISDPPIHSLPPPRLAFMADVFSSISDGGGDADTIRAIIIDAICHDRNVEEADLMIQELKIWSNDRGLEFPTGWKTGSGPYWSGALPGSDQALNLARERFSEEMVWDDRICNTPLWTADPGKGGFRKYPLSKYIHRRYRNRIQFYISDEAHEAANSDSAQSQAEQLGFKLGCPWISMTGTTGNGFPRSYHVVLWHASEAYRREFGYSDSGKFQQEFGYNKRVQEDTDDKGRVVAYGSTSAAKHRTKALSTPAPGIVPLAVMRFITPISVPISVADLEIDLPTCRERVIAVDPDPDQLSEYSRLLTAIKTQATRDRFSERNGALLGVLAQSGTILDRNTTDVGNCDTGGFEVRYSERWGRELVAASSGIPGDRILPKEAALINYVKDELDRGHKTIVGVWHVAHGAERSLTQRIAGLLKDEGLNAAVLDSSKVTPKKRIAWIQRHVVRAGVDVLICNPRAVETGINNLVYFSRIALFDGIGSSPKTYDQKRGRIHRPGQMEETEIVSFVYRGTVQELAHEHLMSKVAVVRATDGTDPREALRAVGAEGKGSVSYSMSLAEKIMRMG